MNSTVSKAQRILEIFGHQTSYTPILVSTPRGLIWDTEIDRTQYHFVASIHNTFNGYAMHIIFTRKVNDNWVAQQIPSDTYTAMHVFSAAVSFVRAAVKQVFPLAEISFSSDVREPSRVRLYNRIANSIARELNGHLKVKEEDGEMYYIVSLYGKGMR